MTLIAASNAPDSVKAKADVVCTGNRDETLISNAAQQGTYLELSQGDFRLGGPVIMVAGRMLKGWGKAVTRLLREPAYLGHLFDVQRWHDIAIRDLSILDDSPEATTAAVDAHAVGFFDCERITLENIEIDNVFRVGFAITACEHVTLRGCSANGARALPLHPYPFGGHGLTLWAPSPQMAQTKRPRNYDVRIVDCDFSSNWRTGIFAMLTDRLIISQCQLKNNAPQEAADHGIEQGGQIGFGGGVTNATLTGNTLGPSHFGQGFEVDVMVADDRPLDPDPAKNIVTQHITIVGNTIREQGFAGVTLWSPPNVPAYQSRAFMTVADNVLLNNNQRGNGFYGAIHAFGRGPNSSSVTDFAVKGNQITESVTGCPGINVGFPSDRYSVTGNHITMTNAQLISMAAAIRDMGGPLARRVMQPNIVQVNGRNL